MAASFLLYLLGPGLSLNDFSLGESVDFDLTDLTDWRDLGDRLFSLPGDILSLLRDLCETVLYLIVFAIVLCLIVSCLMLAA